MKKPHLYQFRIDQLEQDAERIQRHTTDALRRIRTEQARLRALDSQWRVKA